MCGISFYSASLTFTGPAECAFIPLQRHHKSGSTNLPEGVVHIFRDTAKRQSLEELEIQTNALALEADTSDDGVILAVLAVPSWMTPSDFLTFVAPVADGIAHLRIIQYVARIISSMDTINRLISVTLPQIVQLLSSNFRAQQALLSLLQNIMGNHSTRWRCVR